MDQLLTVKEAAKTLAVTEAAIRKWLYQRRLLGCVSRAEFVSAFLRDKSGADRLNS